MRVLQRERGLQIPLAMDSMDDLFMQRYACWPERFFVLYQGRVAYVAHFKLRPSEIEAWIKMYLHVTESRKIQGRATAGPMMGGSLAAASHGEDDKVKAPCSMNVREADLDLYRRIAAAAGSIGQAVQVER